MNEGIIVKRVRPRVKLGQPTVRKGDVFCNRFVRFRGHQAADPADHIVNLGQSINQPGVLAPDHQIRVAVQDARQNSAAAPMQGEQKHGAALQRQVHPR